MRYLSPHPAASSGQDLLVKWRQPAALTHIRLQFPRGTRFDTSALARCTASDQEVVAQGAAACPPATVLGTGGTDATAGPGASFSTHVTLFNAAGQIIVLVELNGTPVTEFRDEVRRDAILVNPVLPAGVSLTQLGLTIGRHRSGRHVYMTNPPTCPHSGRWTTVATFTYADAPGQTAKATTPCRRSVS
jgi:hypothetical protein